MNLSGDGIRVYDNDIAKEQDFYNGQMNMQRLAFDPLLTGFSFIIWTKLPEWVVTHLA